MNSLDAAGLLVSLAALFAWFNHRFIGLPTTIGIMVLALVMSVGILLAGHTVAPGLIPWGQGFLDSIDFSATVLDGMLSFLLFAGALFVDLKTLAERKYVVGMLATGGVILSTFIVGFLAWGVFNLIGVSIPLIWCLVFGALISPTDPIAVLGILKSAGVPKSLETKIVGESLVNDGVAMVVFLVMVGIATTGQATLGGVALLFVQEAVGGLVLGLLLAGIAHRMLASIDQYQVEILITLAVVLGGYSLAHSLHLSGPIAMVVAGAILGNRSRDSAMSKSTWSHLEHFWELLDEMLNAVLFLLIGLEVLVLSFTVGPWLAGALMIPMVLLARLCAVSVPVMMLSRFRTFSPGAIPVLTWGGLRGGISVALVLSLPTGDERDLLVTVTYAVVLFSLLVQGLTVGRLARRLTA
ncbi:cation:proton antiporter [Saccharospirillum salsuginis]|uniref:Sodium:proton antiporter n=1 Tax=Saccharospirillum salsuginis TaxID=418750 RepID=A0A918KPQ0_9GAMM|nr:sodium:proton antiporter [Saccharospirillum salsuginis]GGX71385.1 sodium:proton antiporter [Saccharospirillum salsuginis]